MKSTLGSTRNQTPVPLAKTAFGSTLISVDHRNIKPREYREPREMSYLNMEPDKERFEREKKATQLI